MARAVSNPTPAQTGNLLDFHWSWLIHRPVLWTVLAVIGAVYGAVQHSKRARVQAPVGELAAHSPESGAVPAL